GACGDRTASGGSDAEKLEAGISLDEPGRPHARTEALAAKLEFAGLGVGIGRREEELLRAAFVLGHEKCEPPRARGLRLLQPYGAHRVREELHAEFRGAIVQAGDPAGDTDPPEDLARRTDADHLADGDRIGGEGAAAHANPAGA